MSGYYRQHLLQKLQSGKYSLSEHIAENVL